jgi:intergrase/recombinase
LPYSTKTKYTEKKDPTNVKFSEKWAYNKMLKFQMHKIILNMILIWGTKKFIIIFNYFIKY